MKKILFAIVAVVAFALTSCEGTKVNILDIDVTTLDNTESKCWAFEYQNVDLMRGITTYIWCTEYQIVSELQQFCVEYQKTYNKKVNATYKAVAANDKETCECKNDFNN